jgi:hypothetical protein
VKRNQRTDYHKFDAGAKLAVFFALLIFAGFLEIIHSGMANEVIFGIIGLAGGNIVK